jgi:hypothetical protein
LIDLKSLIELAACRQLLPPLGIEQVEFTNG